ncbi:MAG: hypothetical protein H0W65_08820 [Sphingomonas sp.]|uniref:hypothetical protein n=1 Tax=Sphingomonas sp. TaxID=28214 RepID=UPI0017AD1CE0|nr:hypothetical protein [Sphingomonas sp.]MBA3667810.1 hypothetical protein [Sphingomonas sp.]
MVQRSIPPRSQRVAVLSAAVALHLSLFALLISMGSARPAPAARPGSFSLITLTPEPATGRPPPPALPSKLADTKRILTDIAFSDEPDSTATAAAGGCATLELVQKSLMADPAAIAAVLHTPAESRSVAEAVVIWNAGWSETANTLDAPLGPARDALEKSLAPLADECLDEPVTGPRLLPIPDGDNTMFLVIGSGNWTWRQLLIGVDPAAEMAARQAEPPSGSLWDWF